LEPEVRSDHSVLKALHPDIARQFETLRDQIAITFDSSVILDSSSYTGSSQVIAEHRILIKKFENFLQNIRKLQGF
jgi:hypothetical protein